MNGRRSIRRSRTKCLASSSGSRHGSRTRGWRRRPSPHRGFRGRIDRLILTEREALIVDYKSDRSPPADLANVNADYLRQLAQYRDQVAAVFPEKTIRTALLWTAIPGLMEIPGHALDAIPPRLTRTPALPT